MTSAQVLGMCPSDDSRHSSRNPSSCRNGLWRDESPLVSDLSNNATRPTNRSHWQVSLRQCLVAVAYIAAVCAAFRVDVPSIVD
jgi:hypothetical protein